MIMDKLNEFCDATLITGAAANELHGNYIDLGGDEETRDIGAGEPLYLVIQVATTLAGAGDVTVDLRSADNEALTTNATTHITTGAILYSAWNTAVRKVFALPIENTYRKYLGIWVTNSDTISAGAIDAFLVKDPNSWKPLADNVPAYA